MIEFLSSYLLRSFKAIPYHLKPLLLLFLYHIYFIIVEIDNICMNEIYVFSIRIDWLGIDLLYVSFFSIGFNSDHFFKKLLRSRLVFH